MGSFTIYCAGCAGPFTRPSLGSKSQKALLRRERRVRNELDPGRPDDEVGREEVEEGDKGSEGEETEKADDDDTEIDEDHSYNPEILTEGDLNWLEWMVCLGFDEKAFLSGDGDYIEQDIIRVTQGNDPNCPEGKNTFYCYVDGGSPAVFPFHPECFDILTSVITGSTDADLLDKDILYHVMTDIASRTLLDLDYGAISGNGQLWDSIPGEEFSVKDPSDTPGVKEFLQGKLSSKSFKIPKRNLDLQQKVVKDPLGALPYDVLHLMCSYLPGRSVVSLMTASIPVFLATANNQFWKQRIQRDMPWFWELQDLITENDYPNIDFKGLYLWLDKMTTPRAGIQGTLIAIANRRRIWCACEKIGDMYHSSCY